jgi:hypothetical protein
VDLKTAFLLLSLSLSLSVCVPGGGITRRYGQVLPDTFRGLPGSRAPRSLREDSSYRVLSMEAAELALSVASLEAKLGGSKNAELPCQIAAVQPLRARLEEIQRTLADAEARSGGGGESTGSSDSSSSSSGGGGGGSSSDEEGWVVRGDGTTSRHGVGGVGGGGSVEFGHRGGGGDGDHDWGFGVGGSPRPPPPRSIAAPEPAPMVMPPPLQDDGANQSVEVALPPSFPPAVTRRSRSTYSV